MSEAPLCSACEAGAGWGGASERVDEGLSIPCMGPVGGPRGGAFSYERGIPIARAPRL